MPPGRPGYEFMEAKNIASTTGTEPSSFFPVLLADARSTDVIIIIIIPILVFAKLRIGVWKESNFSIRKSDLTFFVFFLL